jgi:hypothetical protein
LSIICQARYSASISWVRMPQQSSALMVKSRRHVYSRKLLSKSSMAQYPALRASPRPVPSSATPNPMPRTAA